MITERDPDTVRGADVAYYSYARLPKGPLEPGYGPEVPELVFEVRSAGDSWREILDQGRRVSDGRRAQGGRPRSGDAEGARLQRRDEEPVVLGPEDELTFPGLLEGFRVPVHRFFD